MISKPPWKGVWKKVLAPFFLIEKNVWAQPFFRWEPSADIPGPDTPQFFLRKSSNIFFRMSLIRFGTDLFCCHQKVPFKSCRKKHGKVLKGKNNLIDDWWWCINRRFLARKPETRYSITRIKCFGLRIKTSFVELILTSEAFLWVQYPCGLRLCFRCGIAFWVLSLDFLSFTNAIKTSQKNAGQLDVVWPPPPRLLSFNIEKWWKTQGKF